MAKICILVQRYGNDINGGAEVHAQQIVHQLKKFHSVEVVTSCAEEYTTWEPHFEPGEIIENGTKITRLLNTCRDEQQQHNARKKLKNFPKILIRRKLFKHFNNPIFKADSAVDATEMLWIESQGPYIKSLEHYLQSIEDQFDVFIFFTSLYYHTAIGLPLVGHKSILIPLLHNETTSFFSIYNKCFNAAAKILFNTESEKRLAETIYDYDVQKGQIASVGIELNQEARPFHLVKNHVVYIGRVSKAKGCHTLFKNFIAFLEKTGSDLELIIIGKSSMEAIHHPQITFKGFISEEEKNNLLACAKALIIPSIYESLSLVTLESMALGVPVLGSQHCDVIKDHIEASGAGALYHNEKTFSSGLLSIIDQNKRAEFLRKGQAYIKENYNWTHINQVFNEAIESICAKKMSKQKDQLGVT